jgi:uncharacterized protein (DUF433 family)
MSTVVYGHIELTSAGVPVIAGTSVKVVEIAIERLAHHWDADELHRQHPHLTLGQIHAALAYYYDHRDELDEDIDRRLGRIREIQNRRGHSCKG